MTGQQPRMCYFIPADAHVEDEGYRAAIVTEGVSGYALTGTWPQTGAPGEP